MILGQHLERLPKADGASDLVLDTHRPGVRYPLSHPSLSNGSPVTDLSRSAIEQAHDWPPPPAANLVERRVGSYPVGPRRVAAPSVEVPDMGSDGDDRLLSCVERRLVIAQHAPAHCVKPVVVELYEVFEGCPVTAARVRGELLELASRLAFLGVHSALSDPTAYGALDGTLRPLATSKV